MRSLDPFVRWAGGKTWLVPHLASILEPIEFEHYHEPFLGSGAVFFSLEHRKRPYLSDVNGRLINTYIQIRDNPTEVISAFESFSNTEKDYYRIRKDLSDERTAENAARFLFLNQTSFNGLYRVNRDGKYNVPYGFRRKWTYDLERIRVASYRLQNANISVGDFEINKRKIGDRDLVFLDPPYTVSHNSNGFIEYNQTLFSLDDQYRLKAFIEYIKRKGAYYILTNAAHQTIRDIFLTDDDRLISLNRRSLIGGKNAVRTMISEYIFTNIPEVHYE